MINQQKILDSWLVLQSQSGNRKAFSLLVKRWHKKLCKQAYWYTRDIAAAQDVVQECWPIILKKIKGLKDANSFGSWAMTIVNRKSIDWLRKKKIEFKNLKSYYDTYHVNSDDPNNHPPEKLQIELKEAIKNLPQEQQLVLRLFYTEEFSIQEIANILAVPNGTIKSRLFNAREKLKIILK